MIAGKILMGIKTVASENLFCHHDGGGHRGVDSAIIAEGAGLNERKIKTLAGRKLTTGKSTVVAGDSMGHRITIGPGHGSAFFDSKGGWIKREIADGHGCFGCWRWLSGGSHNRTLHSWLIGHLSLDRRRGTRLTSSPQKN